MRARQADSAIKGAHAGVAPTVVAGRVGVRDGLGDGLAVMVLVA